MTSLEVKVLILIAAAAVIYLFIVETRRSRRTARLIAWVQTNHPAAWNSLPWTLRKVHRLGGLARLYRDKAIADPHFAAEFDAVIPLGRNQLVAFAVAAGAFAVLALGLDRGWWHW